MGLGNLNPGFQNSTSSYEENCSCCCDATAHAGLIRRSFFPWIRKIKLTSPQGSVELDPPNSTDTWTLNKTDTYSASSFGLSVVSGYAVSPVFNCQVEWFAYSPGTPRRFRDNTCTGQISYSPVANHSAIITFACIAGKPTVRLSLGTSFEIGVALFNSRIPPFPAPDTVLHSGEDTYVRHGTGWLYNTTSELDGSGTTFPIAQIPVLGTQTFNPSPPPTSSYSGYTVPGYGPATYGESQLFGLNVMLGVLAPIWNPLGILGVTVELLP